MLVSNFGVGKWQLQDFFRHKRPFGPVSAYEIIIMSCTHYSEDPDDNAALHQGLDCSKTKLRTKKYSFI